nr:hypothetical protein [Sphingomonas melonis]
MIRLFLSAETILKLRLAQTYTAALTARIVLLERSVQRFGYVEGMLSEEDLKQEQESLTASLSRMSVGARQFEIPWATLKVDANARNRDTYSTYLSLKSALTEGSAAATRRTTSYPYSNGASVDYEASNNDWPRLYVVAGIVDTFLTHPSAGVESILSVRIRHDNFRREFANAISELQNQNIDGVRTSTFKRLVGELAQDTYKEVQSWLDAKMHTWRKDKSQALFDVLPNKADMSLLLDHSRDLESLDSIIDVVFGWLEKRLEQRLIVARNSVINDLYPALARRYSAQLGRGGTKQTDDERTLVHQAFASSMQRLTNDLQEWFKVPEEDRRNTLSVKEVIQAVEQRFWPDIKAGKLSIVRYSTELNTRTVDPQQIRPLYDLISELAANGLKHSNRVSTRLYLRKIGRICGDALIVSNLRAIEGGEVIDGAAVRVVDGHPATSLNAALFAEGKSGLEKMAYLSAYLAGGTTQIKAYARRKAFHIALPLSAIGKAV